MKCKYCGCSNLGIRERPDTPHYMEEYCPDCGKHQRWIKAPKNKGTPTSSKYSIKQIKEYHNYKEEFCFFCLRTKEQLGNSQTLTIDHIHEKQEGGEDDIKNLAIYCTACHKLKDWYKRYHNWHFKKKSDNNDSKTTTEERVEIL